MECIFGRNRRKHDVNYDVICFRNTIFVTSGGRTQKHDTMCKDVLSRETGQDCIPLVVHRG